MSLCILKRLFYGELKTGTQHKLRKRFKDNLMDNLNALHMDVQHLEELTLNYPEKKYFITEGCHTFENECLRHAQIKRDPPKGTRSDLPNNMQSWKFGVCVCVSAYCCRG